MASGTKIREKLTSEAGRGIVGTMIMKVGSAIIAFALFSFASNAAGVEEFGRFTVLFSLVSILSIVAAMGQSMLVVRSWSEYQAAGQSAFSVGAVRYGWAMTVLGVVVVSIGLVLFFAMTSDWTPLQGSEKFWLGAAALGFLASNTLTLYSSYTARAVVGIKVGDANFELTWRGIAILFLAASLFLGHSVTTTEILAVFSGGLLIVIVSQCYYILRAMREQVGHIRADYKVREWTPRSAKLWIASVMEALNQYMEVFLIGLLLDPVAAGAYFVAARLSNAFALAASGVSIFGTRWVPGLYFSRDLLRLRQTLNLIAGVSLLIVVGGMLCVVVGGDYLLLIFGRSYMDYYLVLVILSVGTAFNAAIGPAPHLLMLTGHEGRYMNVISVSVLLRIVGFFLFVPHFGLIGAALVTTIVMTGMAIVLSILCRNLTGMDPSILRFAHTNPDKIRSGIMADKVAGH